LEEERRLFYVAITRARREVLLTAAAWRRRFDGVRGGQVSRFVDEIPVELLEREEIAASSWGRPGHDRGAAPGARERRPERGGGAWSAAQTLRPRPHRAIGREVWHESFGRGRVLAADGEGGEVKFTVQFESGVKKVMGRFLTGGSGDDAA
jgi:DNA helicase-2/ATP-dependent DNA helicase PcrA